tara:strand:- start:242 stop:547 length:306 start_codon:yes stop_codon:yes gene_type:complete
MLTPITVKKSDWDRKEGPERIQKTFQFKSRSGALHFLNKLIELEEQKGHHAAIMISEDRVTVQLRTKSLDQVTDLDIEYAHIANEIAEDVRHIREEKSYEW